MLEHWPQGVANWPPKFDGILFSALGPIQGHKVQHLLVLGADRKVWNREPRFSSLEE
jgi:hypothetical protein